MRSLRKDLLRVVLLKAVGGLFESSMGRVDVENIVEKVMKAKLEMFCGFGGIF